MTHRPIRPASPMEQFAWYNLVSMQRACAWGMDVGEDMLRYVNNLKSMEPDDDICKALKLAADKMTEAAFAAQTAYAQYSKVQHQQAAE